MNILIIYFRDVCSFPLETSETTVKPKKGSNVTVSSKLPDCTVCTVSGVNDSQTSCQASLNLPEEEVKLQFSCSQPIKESYTVTITSLIRKFTHNSIPSVIILFAWNCIWMFIFLWNLILAFLANFFSKLKLILKNGWMQGFWLSFDYHISCKTTRSNVKLKWLLSCVCRKRKVQSKPGFCSRWAVLTKADICSCVLHLKWISFDDSVLQK